MAPSMRLPTMNLAASLPQVNSSFLDVKDGTRQIRQDIDKRDEREKKRRDDVLTMILKDPKNAQAYSQAYGVPITPELNAILQQPAVAQRMAEAYDAAKSLGIEDPTARNAFTKKYLETGGNLAEAASSIDGMDPRRPLSRYEEGRLNNMGHGGGNSKPRNIPVGFAKSISEYLDQMRGVRYADKERTMLLPGSPAPLDPMTASQIAEQVAVETQRSGNPASAIQKVWNDIGGEAGLQDGQDSPYGYGQNIGGYMSRQPGAVKYKTVKNMPHGSLIPQDEPASPNTGNDVLDIFGGGYDREIVSDGGAMPPVDQQINDATLDTPYPELDQYVTVPDKAAVDATTQPSAAPSVSPVIDRPRGAESDPRSGFMYAKTGMEQPVVEKSINSSPVTVKSPEEARTLPKGTKFITPDGRVKIVR